MGKQRFVKAMHASPPGLRTRKISSKTCGIITHHHGGVVWSFVNVNRRAAAAVRLERAAMLLLGQLAARGELAPTRAPPTGDCGEVSALPAACPPLPNNT